MNPLAYGNFRRDVIIPEYAAHVIPADVPDSDAAALLVNYQAAYTALVRRARVERGEWVLVTAAAGALGSALVQIAHAQGARVVAAAGTDEKCSACLKLGAEVALDSRDPALAAHVRDATDGHGVDVACDLVGGAGFATAVEAAAFEARLLTMGWASGSMPAIEPMSLIVHNLTVIGMSWGAAYPREAPDVVRDTHAQILELYANGMIRPLVDQVVPHTDLPTALAAIATGTTVGKSVMTWGSAHGS
jgi:NADPH2:quinone reductase